MTQCFALGVALGWAIAFGLYARAWGMVWAGSILFANWMLWSIGVLSSDSWEPWLLAMLLDALTAFLLWTVSEDPILAASSAHLVVLHAIRATDWISYELYYDYGWTVGMMQAGWVMLVSVLTARRRLAR